ncbi:MAG: aminotransferase class V-fold PLP-dependent enzyme [Candidatus Tyrphobacter sp.]
MRSTPLPRTEFAVTENLIYLNHAATGVPPRCVQAACAEFLRAQASGGVLGSFPYELRFAEFRQRIASFVGARANEIALLRNTSEAANSLAAGLDLRSGDEVLLPDDEFPANVLPWLALRSRGVAVRFIETARERITPDVLRSVMTSRTRVVALSWVSFADGYRHDLAALAEVAHERGALLCVDAIQGLGVFPIDVAATGIDAFYGGGQKWMLALQGIAYLYVTPHLLDRLEVAFPGWRAMENMWDFLDYDQRFVADASRFEGGTLNTIGALSLGVAVEFLAKHDRVAVAEHVLALTDRLADGFANAGAVLVSLRGDAISSGIVTCVVPEKDPVEIGRALQRQGIVTTYRASGIRVSPHAYNTFDEIDALLAGLRGLSRVSR